MSSTPNTKHHDTKRPHEKTSRRTAASQKRGTGRSDGPCPVMRSCGGCVCLGLPYHKQLARKQQAMDDLFAPLIAHHRWDVKIEPVWGMGGRAGEGALPAPRRFRYKAITPFAPGPHGAVRSGFFARGTHTIVHVDDCAVEAPDARHILNEVGRIAQQMHIPAYDEDAHRGILRYAVLRLSHKRDEGILTLVTAQRNIPHYHAFLDEIARISPQITTIAQNINGRTTNAILGSETHILRGPKRMRDELLGCTFEISPTAFYQTNPQQTETLYRLAIEGMDLHDGDVLLDAYCGSGTIGLCALHDAMQRGCSVHLLGVERNTAGIADAKRNADLNDLRECARFVAEDATAYLFRAAQREERIDVLCIDPPRAGSTPRFIEAACAIGPRRIVYVSCNPATQERDMGLFARGGYRLVRLAPVDMFPHTEHVETVAVLTRQSS